MTKKRRAEQLIRLARKLESIANDMKAEGISETYGVRYAASRLAAIGRSLMET